MSARGEHGEQLEVALFLDETEDIPHRLERQAPPRQGQHLVRERERVPHAPIGPSSQRAQCVRGCVDALVPEDRLQARHDVTRPDAPEVEPLTT